MFKRLVLNIFTFCTLLFLAVQVNAVIETYEFSAAEYKLRYQTMVHELRCPKCQNQNLSGSNSPIAKDLRRELHRMIEEGQGDDEIIAFMVKRYGNFVLYRPPVDKYTLWLWGSPIILLMLALLFVFFLRRSQPDVDALTPLTVDEKNTLDRLLRKYSK
ncbi:MAG: cytochrome c-type biogenesis protein CcmH [Pseudomonadales bacterium]|nr:cytochrome c-type biogenesis protein CcmH [Pseudomonadales bacterium]